MNGERGGPDNVFSFQEGRRARDRARDLEEQQQALRERLEFLNSQITRIREFYKNAILHQDPPGINAYESDLIEVHRNIERINAVLVTKMLLTPDNLDRLAPKRTE